MGDRPFFAGGKGRAGEDTGPYCIPNPQKAGCQGVGGSAAEGHKNFLQNFLCLLLQFLPLYIIINYVLLRLLYQSGRKMEIFGNY